PYSDANTDISRTINDVQPYYIFDAKTIERSGAIDIEDFLKQRLTMNTTPQTSSRNTLGSATMGTDSPGFRKGATSSIDLRGLGADNTLVLVNGRRVTSAITLIYGDKPQPDINGIPLNAVERIEVLPSSASGIYGGGSIGGVVNIVLKNDYKGGDIRLTYDNV